MSVESPISERENWFLGEAKTLRFSVANAAGAAAWTFRLDLRRRRSDVVLVSKPGVFAGVVGDVATVDVPIAAADTAALDAGAYHYALWRTDAGGEQVLAYGAAILREVQHA